MENKKKFTRETFVRKFFKDNRLPFPVQREEFLPYYSDVEGFENLLESFNSYMEKVENKGFSEYVESKDFFEKEMVTYLKNHPKYKEFLTMDVPKNSFDVNENLRKNLYKEDLSDKYYLSVDMNTANFYMLYKLGVVNTDNYKEWLSNFTKEEELLNSKQVRQVLLGQLNNNKLEKFMKLEMLNNVESAHEKGLLDKNTVVTFNKDEVVYTVENLAHMSNLLESKELLKVFNHCSFELFKLVKTKYGFAKEYLDGSYTFHAVPSKYWMENYKEYKGLETTDKDFMFLDENRKLCLRLE